jgi:NAD(P)-dependent dehydrogenase (short-subunit alcohol dehydrogenase family)
VSTGDAAQPGEGREVALGRAAPGKVALISGANKGIGFETARQLGRMGYIVYVAMKGEIAARQMRAEGTDARVVKLDVTRQADIDAAAKKIAAECGVLDALVNNAGVMHEKSWTVNATSATEMNALRATFEANVFAVVAVTGDAAVAASVGRGADRECVEHSGLGELPGYGGLADVRYEAVRVQRVEGRAESVHDFAGA